MERVGGEAPGSGEPVSRQSSAGASRGSQGSPGPRITPTLPAPCRNLAGGYSGGELADRTSQDGSTGKTPNARRAEISAVHDAHAQDLCPDGSHWRSHRPQRCPPRRRARQSVAQRRGAGLAPSSPTCRRAAATPLKIDIFLPQFIAFGYVAVFGMRSTSRIVDKDYAAWTPTAWAGMPPIRRMPPRAAARPGAR